MKSKEKQNFGYNKLKEFTAIYMSKQQKHYKKTEK